jgi:hypothetical protein
VTSVTGSGTTWTVTANPGTTTGTLGLEMANGTGTADTSGAPVIKRAIHDGPDLLDRAEGGLDHACGSESGSRIDDQLYGDLQ